MIFFSNPTATDVLEKRFPNLTHEEQAKAAEQYDAAINSANERIKTIPSMHLFSRSRVDFALLSNIVNAIAKQSEPATELHRIKSTGDLGDICFNEFQNDGSLVHT
ncbi:MAG: hypothetical protein NTZ67_02350 [Gammaproteobacteria bacterium]|nr:hypothetical protein [Gammaproteobacteria bacterium]